MWLSVSAGESKPTRFPSLSVPWKCINKGCQYDNLAGTLRCKVCGSNARPWTCATCGHAHDEIRAPIVGLNQRGEVDHWNAAIEKQTGLKFKKVKGKNMVDELVSEPYRANVRSAVEDAMHCAPATSVDVVFSGCPSVTFQLSFSPLWNGSSSDGVIGIGALRCDGCWIPAAESSPFANHWKLYRCALDVNARHPKTGETPLHLASNCAAARSLLQRGAPA